MQDEQLNFFSDIKEKFILVIVGLASVFTILPLFLMELTDKFPEIISIKSAYGIFVFLYFLLPLAFYLIYCSIHDYIGFLQLFPTVYLFVNKFKFGKFFAEVVFIAIALIYLLRANKILSYTGFYVICFLSLGLFIWQVYKYRNLVFLRGIWKEFVILGSVILLAFSAFFLLSADIIEESFSKDTWEHKDRAFDAFTCRNKINALLDTTVARQNYFYQRSLEPLIKSPNNTLTLATVNNGQLYHFKKIYEKIESIDTSKNMDIDEEFINSVAYNYKKIDENLNNDTSKFSPAYKIYEMSYYLNDYAKRVISEKQGMVTELLRERIVILQFKGLAWLLLLTILSLCLWLNMQERFRSQQLLYAPTEKLQTQKDAQLIITQDNISQSKIFLYISLLLVIPFFREIEPGDITDNKPFLAAPFMDSDSKSGTTKSAGKIDLNAIVVELNTIKRQINILSNNQQAAFNLSAEKLKAAEKILVSIDGQWVENEKH